MDTAKLSTALLDIIIREVAQKSSPDLSSEAKAEAFWNTVLDRCMEQGIQGLTAQPARTNNHHAIPDQVMMDWDATLLQMEIDYENQKARLQQLLTKLEHAGQRVVVLKGLSVAKYWPVPSQRPVGDFDLRLSDPLAGDDFFTSMGLKVSGSGKHTHLTYKGISVENHHLLLGTSNSDLILSQRIEACPPGQDHSLSPTAAYLFLMAHLGRHFLSYESINLRQLLDLVFMVQSCRDHIDRQYIRFALCESGLDRFNDLVIAVLKQYLYIDSMDAFATGNRFSAREKARVFRDILSSKKRLPSAKVKALAERGRRFLAQSWKYAYHPDSLIEHLLHPSILSRG